MVDLSGKKLLEATWRPMKFLNRGSSKMERIGIKKKKKTKKKDNTIEVQFKTPGS